MVMVKRMAIVPSKTNPRKNFDPVKLEELAATIRQHGILQPLLVRPIEIGKGPKVGARKGEEYELVAGERRWRGAGLAKLEELPCIVREMSDKEVLEVQYIENLQRDDLTALEEADGFRRLIDEGLYTAESLAAKLGKSRSHVFGRLKLCKLHGPVRKAVEQGKIDASIAGLIAKIPDPKDQEEVLEQVQDPFYGDEPMSFRDAAEYIEREFCKGLKGAKFDEAVVNLVPGVPSCLECPKRSGNMKEAFPELAKSPNVCTDPKCYAQKEKRYAEVTANECKAKGFTFLPNGERLFESYNDYKVRGHSGYVEMKNAAEGDKKSRTWQTLLGNEPKGLVITFDERGKRRRLLKREDAYALAKAAGFELKKLAKASSASGSHRYDHAKEEAKRAERDKKAKRLEKVAGLILPEFRKRAQGLKLDRKFLGMLVEYSDDWRMRREIKKPTEKLSEAELVGLLFESALASRRVDSYPGVKWNSDFLDGCKVLKIDVKAYEKEVPEEEPTKETKSTKAGKGGAKKKGGKK